MTTSGRKQTFEIAPAMRFACFLASLLVLFACTGTGTQTSYTKPLEEQDWVEVRASNFRLLSMLSEGDTVSLVRRLEAFRAAIPSITNVGHGEISVPVHFFVLRGAMNWNSVGLGHDSMAALDSNLRDVASVARKGFAASEAKNVIDSFARILVWNHEPYIYPMWFDVGISEYLSGAGFTEETLQIGIPDPSVLNSLSSERWIPIELILSREHYDSWSNRKRFQFHAEAWALVHYLINRDKEEPGIGAELNRYVELVESGRAKTESFEAAFGIGVDELNREVWKYVRDGKYLYREIEIDNVLPEFDYEIYESSREDIALQLGLLALRFEAYDQAEHWLMLAKTNDRFRPRAEAGLGKVLWSRSDRDGSLRQFSKAVKLAPNDAYCRLDLAGYWLNLADEEHDSERRRQYFESSRHHFVKAWELDDSIPETYAMYGKSFIIEGRRYEKAIEMLEEAKKLQPYDFDIRMMLAEAFAGAGRMQDAVSAARSVAAWDYANNDRARDAKKLIDNINSESAVVGKSAIGNQSAAER